MTSPFLLLWWQWRLAALQTRSDLCISRNDTSRPGSQFPISHCPQNFLRLQIPSWVLRHVSDLHSWCLCMCKGLYFTTEHICPLSNYCLRAVYWGKCRRWNRGPWIFISWWFKSSAWPILLEGCQIRISRCFIFNEYWTKFHSFIVQYSEGTRFCEIKKHLCQQNPIHLVREFL